MFRSGGDAVVGGGGAGSAWARDTSTKAIGAIRILSGSATVTRSNGATVAVHVGLPVFQGDVIVTDADGAVGIEFQNGTAFNLGASTCMVLDEFICDSDGALRCGLFGLQRGTFNFISGKLVQPDCLSILTPFGTIRSAGRGGGMGIVTLAIVMFSIIKEAQAASQHAAFLDDDVITYRDLEHGAFEIVTKETNPRTIIVDDPGTTVVIRPSGSGGTFSIDHVPNSASRMIELQAAARAASAVHSQGQQDSFIQQHRRADLDGDDTTGSIIRHAGAWGSEGYFVAPISLTGSSSVASLLATVASSKETSKANSTDNLNNIFNLFQSPPPLPDSVTVIENTARVNVQEFPNTVNSLQRHAPSGSFANFFGATDVSLVSSNWSAGGAIPSDTAGALDTALTASASGGTLSWDFELRDNLLDFLAQGETLALEYSIAGQKQVFVTLAGTNDRPVVASGNTTKLFSEISDQTGSSTPAQTSGTFNFTDIDLTDQHAGARALVAAQWSAGWTIPSGALAAFTQALAVKVTVDTTTLDSTKPKQGTAVWNFNLADNQVDFLAAGETLRLIYFVGVQDDSSAFNRVSQLQQVTIGFTGTNDRPVIANNDAKTAYEQNGPLLTGPTGSIALLTASGAIAFTDVDLTDTHTVPTPSLTSVTWSKAGGIIPALTLAELAKAGIFQAFISNVSSGDGTGTLTWNFRLTDHFADFLRVGETLTLVYDVTVQDDSLTGNATAATRQVTVTIVGTNDRPVIANNDARTVHEQDGSMLLTGPTGSTAPLTTSGVIAFTDVDLSDTHTVPTQSLSSATWSAGGDVPDETEAEANKVGTFQAFISDDSTDDVIGTLSWSFSLEDRFADFLRVGETLTLVYDVTVRDDSATGNATSITKQVTITIVGTNDQPVILSNDARTIYEQDGPQVLTGPTGSTAALTTSGSIAFTDVDLSDTHTVPTQSLSSATWSAGGDVPDETQDELAKAGTFQAFISDDSTGDASGTLSWSFSLEDRFADFLRVRETLTLVYDVTVQDDSLTGNATAVTRQVTVTIVGTNDRPVIANNDARTIHEQDGSMLLTGPTGSTAPLTASGMIAFTDVDLNDTHTAPTPTYVSATWSKTGGAPPPATLAAVSMLGALPLTTSISDDSTGDASGMLSWSFSLEDRFADFLRVGEMLTLVYDVTVRDDSATGNATAATRQVTVTIIGTNDRPVIANDDGKTIFELNGSQFEPDGTTPVSTGPTGLVALLTASGAIAFTDVDLTDTHTVPTPSLSSAAWSAGGDVPDETEAELAKAGTFQAFISNVSSGDGTGTLTWNFRLTDHFADFLRVGETLTLVYDVTVQDDSLTGNATAATRQVTITIVGTNDRPVISGTDVSEDLIETDAGLTASGTVTVTDADITDVVKATVVSVETVGDTDGISNATLLTFLSLSPDPVVDDGDTIGQLTWNFDSLSEAFNYLEAGETLVIKYTIHATDDSNTANNHDDQLITITITGTDDLSDPFDFDSVVDGFTDPLGTHDPILPIIYGTHGHDNITAGNQEQTIYGGAGNDTINGGNQIDVIYAGSGNDVVTGSTQADIIYGGSGNDIINGDTQDDIVIGGYGADTLTGGNGSDIFRFLDKLDTGDTITDFTAGANGEKLDFSLINPTTGAYDPADSGGVFGLFADANLHANSINYFQDGNDTIVWADTDSNTLNGAELQITLNDVIANQLVVQNFIL